MEIDKLRTVELNNGVAMPSDVFGTWRLPEALETEEIIKLAISQGYAHFDTAAHYANEVSIGKAVRESGVPRENLFVTTKLRNSERGYETALADCQRALGDMGFDYFDLYLIHWPAPKKFFDDWELVNAGTWKAFEELLEQGKVRAIGISNFKINQIEALLKTAKVMPSVIQLKLCPGLYAKQAELVAYCQDKGIAVMAYSPLGAGKLLSNPELVRLAEKYGKSPAQMCLAWCVQHEVIPLVKSSAAERMRANLEAYDFVIGDEDMQLLDALPDVEIEIPDSEVVWRD